MKALKDTRSNWVFACPQGLEVTADGIRNDGGRLLFSKAKFKDVEKCEEWIAGSDFSQSKVINESMTKGLAVTEKDWELIQKYLVKKDEFNEEDVVIFEDYLAHNVVDRENERFPKKILSRFNETLPGKRKLMAHDWSGSAGAVGRYFKAALKKVSIDEAIELMNYPDPKRSRKMFEEIEQLDGGIYWLVGTYYVPKHRDQEIKDISAGLYPSSIGFIGVGFEAVEDEKGNFKYWQYVVTPRTEAVEGSLVGVEAQHGAGTVKSTNLSGFRSSQGDEPEEEEIHSKQGDDPQDKTPNGGPMEIKVKAIDYSGEVTDLEGLKEIVVEIDNKVQSALESKQAEIDELKDAKEAAEGNVTEITSQKEAVEKEFTILKSDLVNEVVKAKVQCELLDNKDEVAVSALKEALMKEKVEDIRTKLKEYQDIYDKTHHGNRQAENEHAVIATHVPDTAYQQGV